MKTYLNQICRIILALFIMASSILLPGRATSAQSNVANCNGVQYTVQNRNYTLERYSWAFDIPWPKMQAANPQLDQKALLPLGQVICIPLTLGLSPDPKPAAAVRTLDPDVPESTSYSGQLIIELDISNRFTDTTTNLKATDLALSLDGRDDYVELPADIITPTSGTISHWVRRSKSSGRGVLAYAGNAENGTANGAANGDGWTDAGELLEIHTAVNDSGNAYFAYQNGLGESALALSSDTYLEPEEWYHVAVTWDVVTPVLPAALPAEEISATTVATTTITHTDKTERNIVATLFVNGTAEAVLELPYAESALTPTVMLLGSPAATNKRLFQGELDELQIWQRALTPQQISALYEGEVAVNNSDIAGYWRFDGTDPERVNDHFVDARGGTLFGDADRVSSTRLPQTTQRPDEGRAEAEVSGPCRDMNHANTQLCNAFVWAKNEGVFDPAFFPNLQWITAEADREAALTALEALAPDVVVASYAAGLRLALIRTGDSAMRYDFVPESLNTQPTLFLVESYRLTSIPGDYGTGRILNTFSLLPGEETSIVINTYKEQTSAQSATSSILDSFSEETAQSFEKAVSSEDSSYEAYQELEAWAEGEVSWGFKSAELSTEGGATNSARGEFARDTTNALTKQAARASASRNIEINTSSSISETSGTRLSTTRTVANPNESRTLNFVFYQMNQEYISLLHLVDVRIGYFDGKDVRVVPLSQLDSLLERFGDGTRQSVQSAVVDELQAIFDYRDDLHVDFVETKYLRGEDGPSYLRINPNKQTCYPLSASAVNAGNGAACAGFPVAGILIAEQRTILRTDGVYVDALLGESNAWDAYNQDLHDEEVRELRLRNDQLEAEIGQQ